MTFCGDELDDLYGIRDENYRVKLPARLEAALRSRCSNTSRSEDAQCMYIYKYSASTMYKK